MIAARHGDLTAAHDLGAVSGTVEAIDAPVAVLAARVQGLEFDHVVVVEPSDLVAADRAGLRLLFVVLTRATRTHGRAQRAAARSARARPDSRPAERCLRMTITEADRSAADVAWDLEPLVDGAGEGGVDGLLDEAEARARSLRAPRAIAELDAAGLATVMEELAAIGDLAGRAGSYAGLRFAVDTQDPANGALIARAEERTAINNEILFVELEWAALPDERGAAGRRPPRALPPLPRGRPPVPPAPAERAGGADPLRQVAHREQRGSACSRSSRRRSPSTSAPRPAR